jgi:hypothetical protein
MQMRVNGSRVSTCLACQVISESRYDMIQNYSDAKSSRILIHEMYGQEQCWGESYWPRNIEARLEDVRQVRLAELS